MDKTFDNKIFYYIVFILSFTVFISCEKEIKYPESLTSAIDYFYLENHNEQVLAELNKTLALHPDKETTQLCKIFIAASICEKDKCDSAATLLQNIDIMSIQPNSELMLWYKSIKGLILFRQNKLSQAYSLLGQTITNKEFNNKAIGLNERLMARICISLGEYKKGIEWLLLSSEHFSNAGMQKSDAINNKILGRYYMTTGNYSEALKKFQLAEKVMIKSNDKLELFYVYINFIDYYLKINDLSKAKYYANLCFLQCQHYTDNQMKTLVYNNMGEIEFKQQNYEAAISFFQKTIALPTNFDSGKIRSINAHIGLSKNFVQLKQPVEALRHAKVAQSLANVSGIKQLQFEANNNLAQCYKVLKMDRLAYCYLDTAVLNLDSAFHEASQTTKAFYETKADLVKVASKMEHLKQQQKKQHIMYLSVIMVLFILITLAFIIFRLQHSKNEFLKELVKKNVEIIEEERRFSMTLQQQILPRKAIRKSADNEKSEMLFNQLTSWLETEKRFTQAELSLELVARELNTNREYLSRAINDQNIHFNDLINKYRVQEAIQILTDSGKKNAHFKLSYIANKVGFNSNSAFIDAFKKKTGLNPAEFRKNLYAPE